jgi:cytochrome c oxidase subunit 2
LHIAGEFVESNLGTAVGADGKVTVRLVGQQYSFQPQCLVVPVDTPVTFRATSTDAIHGFIIGTTNANTMLVPGFVTTFTTQFHKAGEQLMPCHEYCGTGHEAMWARVQVLSAGDFAAKLRTGERLSCVSR